MNTFQSVSTLVDNIKGTRKRSLVLSLLGEVKDQLASNSAYSELEVKVDKMAEQISNRELPFKKFHRRLDRRILNPLEALESNSSSFSEDGSITDGLASAITRTLVFTNNGGKVDASDVLDKPENNQIGISRMEEVRYFRHFFNAPVNHYRLGLGILASTLALSNVDTKKKVLKYLAEERSKIVGDLAVTTAFKAAYSHIESGYTDFTIADIVSYPSIQSNAYCLAFFTPKNFGSDNNVNVRPAYKNLAEIKTAIRRLSDSYKELVFNAGITKSVTRFSKYYISYSFEYKPVIAEISSQLSEELRDVRASRGLTDVRSRYASKFDSKIPTKFTPASAYTLKTMPVEAQMKNFRLTDEKALKKFGIRVNSQQFTKYKKDSSIFYEDQVVLFFDRNIIKEMVTEIIQEGLDSQTEAKNDELKRARKFLSDKRKLLKTLQTKLADDKSLSKPQERRINNEVMEINEEIAKLESNVERLKKSYSAVKKANEKRAKSLLGDPSRILELGLEVILKQINSRVSNEFELFAVSYPTNPKSAKSSMAWLMESTQVRSLRATFNDISVKSWNLPWTKQDVPSEVTKRKR